MGKKFNLYYEQLKSKMAGQPPMNLQDAMTALKAEQQAPAPQGGEAQARFDYAQKCSNAIMDCAAEKIRKESAWDAAVKNIAKLTRKPNLTISKGTGDWLVGMMKTDGTGDSLAYNETLAIQMALCTGKITRKEASAAGQTNYRDHYGLRYNNADIENLLRENILNAPQKLLEELDKAVQQGQQLMEAFRNGANDVLGLKADQETLNQAFAVIESDDIKTLHNAQDCLNDFKTFVRGHRLPVGEAEKTQKTWPLTNKEYTDSVREMAEQLPDQFYADLNQEEEEIKEEKSIDDNSQDEKSIDDNSQDEKSIDDNSQDEKSIDDNSQDEKSIDDNSQDEKSIDDNSQDGKSIDDSRSEKSDADLPFAMEDEEEEEEIKEEEKPPFVPGNKEDQPPIAPGNKEDQPHLAPEDKDDLPRAYSEAGMRQLKLKTLNDHLDPYGLTDLDRTFSNGSGYTVYEDTHGNVNILRLDEIKAVDGGVSFELHDDAPGRYVNYDLAKQTDAAIRNCKKLEKEDENHPHSKEYLDLSEKLNALRDINLSDQPSWMEVTEAGTRFDYFKKSLEQFEEAQKRRDPKGSSQREYTTALEALKKFAKEKLSGLEAVAGHIATKDRAALKAEEIGSAVREAQTNALGDNTFSSPDDYLKFATDWHKKMENTPVDYNARREAAAEWSTRISERDGEVQAHIAEDKPGKAYSEISGIFGALQHPFDELDQQDSAKMKAMLGDDLFQAGVNGKLMPEELADTLAKNALACGVVKELLNLESKMNIKGNPPIRDLVNSGKLTQVVDMVKNSQSFGENYRSMDLGGVSEKQLNDILSGKAAIQKDRIAAPREIAQDIMKSYLAQQREAAKNAKALAKKGAPVANPMAGKKAQPKVPG